MARRFVLGALVVVAAASVAAAPRPVEPVAREVAVFAGGCFWGVQAVFEHVQGVLSAESGYAGGGAEPVTYRKVGTGTTGHAEAVRITFDPSKVSYEQLLDVFFTVAHDPTQLNRQGPDVGPQYRSAVWYTTPAQRQAVAQYIARATEARTYRGRIVTEVGAFRNFHTAEAYHQDYYFTHPESAYIRYNDVPKVRALKRQFPNLWRDDPARFVMETAGR